jgi:2-(1,2-epoxy-1,2-dihydrophenyl)acetyl-CoA isomerase
MPIGVLDDGPVRIVTIDRPKALNALDPEHFRQLGRAIAAAMAAPTVRVVVLAGEGRTFCFGADLHAFDEAVAAGTLGALVDDVLPVFQRTIIALAEGHKPTVAAVTGPAAGAGLDLALACDLRVLGEKATLVTAYGRVGLVPDGGTPHHLIRLIGAARAKELLLLHDRVVWPEEALRWGLATEVVPREAVRTRAIALAQRIAAGPATALRLVKRLLSEDPTRTLYDALEDEAASQRVAIADPDAAEGIRAAIERRPPAFPSAGTPPPSTGSK